MINDKLLEIVKTKLSDTYSPLSIYVFGSYAWGTPTQESDLDLVVVVEKSSQKSYVLPVAGIRALRGLGIAKDLLVYTQEEFKMLSQDMSSLLYKVKHQGIKLL